MKKIPQREIFDLLAKLDGTVGLYIENCLTGEVFTINGDIRFPSASVIKIPMLGRMLQNAQDGLIDLNEHRSIATENKVGGTGILSELDDSYSPSLDVIAKLMIIMSDNQATNEIIDLIGVDNLNDWCRELGFENTILMRKMMDFDAIKAGRNNYTSALDMGRMCSQIAKGELVSKEISDTMFEIMCSQKYRNKLPALVPAVDYYTGFSGVIPEGEVLVANKTGDLYCIQHDVGIFELPDKSRYVIAMLTKDLQSNVDGIRAISEVSRIVYDALK